MAYEQTIYSSAARTATPTAVEVNTRRFKSVVLVLDVTAIVTAPSIVVTIDRKDNTSGKYINILTGAAVTTVSTNTYRFGLGAPVTANVSANEPLPGIMRITVTHGNGNSITYSASVHLN
jgi:hypothetical protein